MCTIDYLMVHNVPFNAYLCYTIFTLCFSYKLYCVTCSKVQFNVLGHNMAYKAKLSDLYDYIGCFELLHHSLLLQSRT